MISFILIGDEIERMPKMGIFKKFPKSDPTPEALYLARLHAAKSISTKYFSIIDGGPDILLDGFENGMTEICKKLDDSLLDVGSARERIRGRTAGYMHHGVVFRTSAFKKLIMPSSGCYAFESIVSPMLSKRGVVIHDEEVYDWLPSENGAATWPRTILAHINSRRWVNGIGPIPSRE